MILVAGATGSLGREISRRLASQGRRVRGLVRSTSDPEVVGQLRRWEVEPVLGDLKDAASLARACAGAETVVSTVSTTLSRQEGDTVASVDEQGQLALVDAARAAGVSQFVYVSLSGQTGGDDPLTRAKRAVEERVRTSGMRYTILRPCFFMEIWLSPALGFDYLNATATLYGTGENPISFVSYHDVAAFAVHSIESRRPSNATLEVGGPKALSPREAVRIFERVSGRKFSVQTVPEEVLRAQRAAAVDPLQQTVAALMLSYAAGDAIPMEATLGVYPLPLRSVREYARQVVPLRPPLPGAS